MHVARRPPAQPHPVPGRGGVVRLRRLGARADEAAVRAQGGAALRLGRAAAARAAARRRSRGRTSPSASARASARSGRRSTRCSLRRRAIPQRAMLLAHRLWEEVEPKGTATPRGLGARARGCARRAAAGVRGPVARARHVRAEDAARDPRRRRLALPGGRARAAGADQDERAEGAAAAELARRDRGRQDRKQAIVDPLFAEWIAGLA